MFAATGIVSRSGPPFLKWPQGRTIAATARATPFAYFREAWLPPHTPPTPRFAKTDRGGGSRRTPALRSSPPSVFLFLPLPYAHTPTPPPILVSGLTPPPRRR